MKTLQSFSAVGAEMQKILDILNPIFEKNPEDLDESMKILEKLQEKYGECLEKKGGKSVILQEFRNFSEHLFSNANISENSKQILLQKSEEYEKKLEEFVMGNLLDFVRNKNFWRGVGLIFDFSGKITQNKKDS